MADNWYVILELDFDPPVEDEQKIAEKIEEKSKFWSSHFNDFKMGPQYRGWHQNIAQIKKDMIGPSNRRRELAKEACTLVYEPVDKLVKTIGRKGSISDSEGEKIAQKLKLSVDVVKKRAAALKIKWSRGEPRDYQAIYDKYYKTKPQGAANFDGMKQMLSTFDADNLYDFLYKGTTVKNASSLPASTLCGRAKELKEKEYYKHDSISGTGSKLCSQCELIFKDDASKAAYDRYLEYIKRKSILDDVKNIAEISGEISKDNANDTIGQLTQLLKDRKLSEEILTAFCKIEKIAYNSGGEQTSSANVKVCRCGFINDVSDGRKICASCGLELVITCPKCGNKSDSNVRVCKCGFRFEDLDKAMALFEQAEIAIDALDFKAAEAHLSDAQHYWPNSPKAGPLKDRLREYENRVGLEVAKMTKAIDEKRYFEAKNQYTRIQRMFPGYSNASLEQEINQAITKAQELYNQAKATKDQTSVLELCAQAYDLCCDLPGIRELMPAPSAVTGFNVKENPDLRANNISWTITPDKSIRYIVVRSKSGWVQNASDGEVIFSGSASSYSDAKIEPGIPYYYNVFAQRAGVYSQGASGNMRVALNLFEIANPSITGADSSLSIMWDALPSNAQAEIYEILPAGGEKLISSSTSDCCLITGLTNGKSYRYRVALSYAVGGERKTTSGVVLTGTPDEPQKPIDTLRVKPGQNDVFEAVWSQEQGCDVRLFCSDTKPQYNLGDVVALSTLEREMRPLQQRPLSSETQKALKSDERGAAFVYGGSELLYIVAVAVKSGSAVFGTLARASKGECVKINDIKPVNGTINIYIDPPKNATGFIVLYRFDRFPTDIGDVKTVRKRIPLKQYQLNNAIVIDTLEEKKYFFSVFAEFRRDGESDYSAGADSLFDNSAKVNITYSISVSKRLFGDNQVVLEFEADSDSFILPDIDIMSATDNTPMFKSSASLFHSIPSQQVNGKLQVKIPLPKGLQRNTYIKAFLKDEKLQSGNQLRLKLGSNYKIN